LEKNGQAKHDKAIVDGPSSESDTRSRIDEGKMTILDSERDAKSRKNGISENEPISSSSGKANDIAPRAPMKINKPNVKNFNRAPIRTQSFKQKRPALVNGDSFGAGPLEKGGSPGSISKKRMRKILNPRNNAPNGIPHPPAEPSLQ
jgi:hypothetical protein